MIAAVLVHLLIVGVLATLAALLGEQALQRLRLPTRWIWIAALLVTPLVPVMALVRAQAEPAHHPASAMTTADAPLERLTSDAASPGMAWPRLPSLELPGAFATLDRPLVLLWGAASLLALVRLAGTHARLHRRRGRWPSARVGDAEVRVAPDVGPAVAGVRRAAIVLPDWALGAPPELVRLMLAHEREHVRARDPLLLLTADVLVALAPWHPALHWQRRRLRLAVELDCDARVLRDQEDARPYAELLIAVASRPSTPAGLAAAVALAPRPSTLHRRITAMTEPRQRRPLTALLCGSAAALVALAACEAPRPTAPLPENEIPLAAVVREVEKAPADSVSVYRLREVDEAELTGEARVALRQTRAVRDSLERMVARGELVAGEAVFHEVDPQQPERVSLLAKVDLDEMALDPEEIDRIEVVKGKAATRLYGEAASGGVVTVYRRDSTARATAEYTAAGTFRVRQAAPERAGSAGEARVAGVLRRSQAEGREAAAAASTTQPLVVIDGVIAGDPGVLDRLSPDEIASVEIVKAAAALRQYGERGRNGVILVTTKGGGR